VYTIVNPITLKNHNISFVIIVQFKNFCYDTIVDVSPTISLSLFPLSKRIASAARESYPTTLDRSMLIIRLCMEAKTIYSIVVILMCKHHGTLG
jgi:hypothetical protein